MTMCNFYERGARAREFSRVMVGLYAQLGISGNPMDHYASLNAGHRVVLDSVYGKITLIPEKSSLSIECESLEAQRIVNPAVAGIN